MVWDSLPLSRNGFGAQDSGVANRLLTGYPIHTFSMAFTASRWVSGNTWLYTSNVMTLGVTLEDYCPAVLRPLSNVPSHPLAPPKIRAGRSAPYLFAPPISDSFGAAIH